MDVTKFMKLAIDPSPRPDTRPDTFPYGVSSHVKDFLRSLETAKDPPLVAKEPVGPDNEGGKLSKIGSYSDSNDQQPPGTIIIDSEAEKN